MSVDEGAWLPPPVLFEAAEGQHSTLSSAGKLPLFPSTR